MPLPGRTQCRQLTKLASVDASLARSVSGPAGFRRSRPSSVTLRRAKRTVVRASSGTDASGMSIEQTQKALDAQLRQSSLEKLDAKKEEKLEAPVEQEETQTQAEKVQREMAARVGSMDEEQISKAMERQLISAQVDNKSEAEGVQREVASRVGSMDDDQVAKAIQRQIGETLDESKTNGEESRSNAETVQREMAARVGSMDEEQIAKAMQRQVGATPADWSGDEEDDEELQKVEVVDESASGPAEQTVEDDGTVVFTADALQAVSYDDIKMPQA